MKHNSPEIDVDKLEPIDPEEFERLARAAIETDTVMEDYLVEGAELAGAKLNGLHASHVLFRGCRFSACRFRRCSLSDVQFQSCDVSGCDLSDSRLVRCELTGSKAMGAIFAAGYLQDFGLNNTKAHYLNLSDSRLFFPSLLHSDLTGADFSRCEIKSAQLTEVTLQGASFYGTPLKGVDLSSCEIGSLGVTVESQELRGATLDYMQLAELADLLGIQLK